MTEDAYDTTRRLHRQRQLARDFRQRMTIVTGVWAASSLIVAVALVR